MKFNSLGFFIGYREKRHWISECVLDCDDLPGDQRAPCRKDCRWEGNKDTDVSRLTTREDRQTDECAHAFFAPTFSRGFLMLFLLVSQATNEEMLEGITRKQSSRHVN